MNTQQEPQKPFIDLLQPHFTYLMLILQPIGFARLRYFLTEETQRHKDSAKLRWTDRSNPGIRATEYPYILELANKPVASISKF